MRTVVLMRDRTGDSGTFGRIVIDDGTRFFTGELPWRNNLRGKSCIPPGSYLCTWLLSRKHGWCYHVTNVPGREAVEIHSANWMGDSGCQNPATKRFYVCQLEGCIAPGMALGTLESQDAVLDSAHALEGFEKSFAQPDGSHEPFQLIVHDVQTSASGGVQ